MIKINIFVLIGYALLSGCLFAWYAADIGVAGIVRAIKQEGLCGIGWHSWSKAFEHSYCFGRAKSRGGVITYEILNLKCKRCPKTKFAGLLINNAEIIG